MANPKPGRNGAPRRQSKAGALGRWIAGLLVVTLLAACQNGGLSYDPSTGRFNMPFGAGSHRSGGD